MRMTQITADIKLMIETYSLDHYFHNTPQRGRRYCLKFFPNNATYYPVDNIIPESSDEEHLCFWKNFLTLLDYPIFDYRLESEGYDNDPFFNPDGIQITDPHWTLTNCEELQLWLNEHETVGYGEKETRFYVCSLTFRRERFSSNITPCFYLNNFLTMLKEFGFEEEKCGTHTEFRKPKQVN